MNYICDENNNASSLKKNYTNDKYFHIVCTEVIIEHIFVGFIQTWLSLSKQSNKNWFSTPRHN